MTADLSTLQSMWTETLKIWNDGGWAMYGIAVLSVATFGTGVHLWLRLRERGLDVPESVWRDWVEHPGERTGPVGKLLDFVTKGRSHKEMLALCDQVRTQEQAPFERDLKIMKTCVGAAPLMGLLGTVTGMLATFAAMAQGSGGDETMNQVTSGIAEALITTETGLVVALPGLFFQFHLARSFQRYKAFLLHVESVCAQSLHNQDRRSSDADTERAARAYIEKQLRSAISG